jgi:ABC transporter substrate binding protein
MVPNHTARAGAGSSNHHCVRSGRLIMNAATAAKIPVLAAKAATTTIPIVFGFGADPVETGLVSSLDHPGGNITGITSMTVDIGSKRLGLLRDLLPRATRVAMLVDPNDDATVVKSMIADVRGAAIPIGRKSRSSMPVTLANNCNKWWSRIARHLKGRCQRARAGVRKRPKNESSANQPRDPGG